MDRAQEELQFLGLFGILKETFKIVFSWRKIFSQITLALIFPLSFLYVAYTQFSELIFSKTINDYGAPQNNSRITSAFVGFWVFRVVYFTVTVILSLLATAAVVYTIACVYTSKPIYFKKVMSVVPKVWKRLLVTFLWSWVFIFVYNVIAIIILVLLSALATAIGVAGIVLFVIAVILYVVGLFYIVMIWNLAAVVSVLEEVYGFKALKKSRQLIKGKLGVSVVIFFIYVILFAGVEFTFDYLVMSGSPVKLAIGIRILIGILCFLLLVKVIVFNLVTSTILYFVYKSHHHENIDRPTLSEHLEEYNWEYVPLRSRKDVQMEQLQV